jgi:hypothetical protein
MSNNRNYKRRLNHYKLVSGCETLYELRDAILRIAEDNNGWINGKTKSFDAQTMANNCVNFLNEPLTSLTRNYGIRQQAIYILYYQEKLCKSEETDISSVTLGDIAAYIHHML